MIPKIIHYCWLSGDPFPPLIEKCLASWQEKLSDYEFILWDTNRFKLKSNIWVQQAFESKKYAFAADYIRLYAVYHYGGIYLDTDIEVFKSFNDLLDRPYFIGTEDNAVIEAAVFGAEKNKGWLKICLDYYSNKKFIREDGSHDTLTLPRIMMAQIASIKSFHVISPLELVAKEQDDNPEVIYLFPKDYFCAKNHGTGVIEKTKNTYCIHHFAMSWINQEDKFLANFKRKLMSIFGVKTISIVIRVINLRGLKAFFN
jgi:hypothetical protein